MDSSIKKASLSSVALIAIAAVCWLGIRGADPARSSRVQRPNHVPEPVPVMENEQKPVGNPQPRTTVKKGSRHANGNTLIRKSQRRAERRIEKKKVYPQS